MPFSWIGVSGTDSSGMVYNCHSSKNMPSFSERKLKTKVFFSCGRSLDCGYKMKEKVT